MKTAYYKNAIDMENAQKYLGNNVTYKQWTPETQTTDNDYLLGGTAVIAEGTKGKRLAGLTADDTARAIQEESWRLQKPQPVQAKTQSVVPQTPAQPLLPSSDPMSSVIGSDPELLAYYRQAQQAAKLGSRNAMETLNTRGILNSSITGDTVTGLEQQAVTDILPQLYAFQEQKKQQARQDAYNRMNMLGYADNEVAKVLGIEVGTPSASYSMQEAGLTGMYKGSPTMAAQNQTFNQNMTTQQFDYQKQQDQWAREYQQQGFDFDTSYKLAQLDLQKQQLVQSQTQFDKNYALNQQELSSNNAYRNASLAIDRQNANTAAVRATQDTIATEMNGVIQRLNSIYVSRDPITQQVSITPGLKDAILSMVMNGSITKEQGQYLYSVYGF